MNYKYFGSTSDSTYRPEIITRNMVTTKDKYVNKNWGYNDHGYGIIRKARKCAKHFRKKKKHYDIALVKGTNTKTLYYVKISVGNRYHPEPESVSILMVYSPCLFN